MPSTTIYKFPMPYTISDNTNNPSFLKSSFTKAITPLRTTALSSSATTTTIASLTALLASTHSRTPTSSSSTTTTTTPGVHQHRHSRMCRPSSTSQWATAFALLSITLLSYCSLLSSPNSSSLVSSAPAKHTLAPANLVSAMALTFSDTSPLPLQLQIESQVRGTQKLAYLPTSGPSLDFYYLNYRPTYIAGQSTIDFWMISPKGVQAPKTASLELFDEFGKIKLATLVKEGTEIPQGKKEVVNGDPFLWKSWVIPKELKSDFEFSDKFRVVLRTSDNAPPVAPAVRNNGGGKGKKAMNKKVVKNDKRSILDKIFKRAAAAAAATAPVKKAAAKDTKSTVKAAGAVVVVQDRQFRIKGLQAIPGGKVNPAKFHVNSIAPAPAVNSGANYKLETSNPNDTSTPAPANNEVATADPVAPHVEDKKSSAVSSMADINLSVSVIVTLVVTFLTFLGLLL